MLEKDFSVCSQVESILSAQTCLNHRMLSFGDIRVLLYTSVQNKIEFSLLYWYIIDMLIFFILFLKIHDFFKLYYSTKFHFKCMLTLSDSNFHHS
jgi:hypothetical protein